MRLLCGIERLVIGGGNGKGRGVFAHHLQQWSVRFEFKGRYPQVVLQLAVRAERLTLCDECRAS